mmetsp:Transcript_2990/g.5727  ORF Transcript_2990/g.5727 Transcript_2990/m.5727 type:complete len:95 (+) Transcript_2990:57-341(+)
MVLGLARQSLRRVAQRLPSRSLHATAPRRAKAFKGKPFSEAGAGMNENESMVVYTVGISSAVLFFVLCFKPDRDPYKWAERIAAEELGPDPNKE